MMVILHSHIYNVAALFDQQCKHPEEASDFTCVCVCVFEILLLTEQRLEIAHIFVYISFARCFVDDIFIIIISQTATKFLIIHLWLVLPDSPTSSNLIRIN